MELSTVVRCFFKNNKLKNYGAHKMAYGSKYGSRGALSSPVYGMNNQPILGKRRDSIDSP